MPICVQLVLSSNSVVFTVVALYALGTEDAHRRRDAFLSQQTRVLTFTNLEI